MNLLDTIAAISTPHGKGGVAVIRISGRDAFDVADRVFVRASGEKLCDTRHACAVYGEIFMPDCRDNSIDDGIATVFRAPRSFTGEDTVEISCHGGVLVTRRVLAAILCAGARSAEAGEFTRRAFVNGKMKLTEAEALGDLLDAGSEGQLALARGGMRGLLSNKTDELYSALVRVMSGIYAVIDFPDEDLSDMSREEMEDALASIAADIRRLAATYGTGRAVNEGIPTAICGRTNAGKSSVYNRILGYDAAIVTDVEGTTRDVLRETAVLGDTKLLLCDTAGIRDTADKVERIGIERSHREIESAGLVLVVFDGTREPDADDISLAEKIRATGVPAIALVNKSDLLECERVGGDILHGFDAVIRVSAATGEGFDKLTDTVNAMFIDGDIDMANDAVVTGARQYALLTNSAELLERALEDMRAGMSLDACCVGVECAMAALGEVDGREIGEEIVASIFSRFCVGK